MNISEKRASKEKSQRSTQCTSNTNFLTNNSLEKYFKNFIESNGRAYDIRSITSFIREYKDLNRKKLQESLSVSLGSSLIECQNKIKEKRYREEFLNDIYQNEDLFIRLFEEDIYDEEEEEKLNQLTEEENEKQLKKDKRTPFQYLFDYIYQENIFKINYLPEELISKKDQAFIYYLFKAILIQNPLLPINFEENLKNRVKISGIDLNKEYSKENFTNIIKYVKNFLNCKFPYDIIEKSIYDLLAKIPKFDKHLTLNLFVFDNQEKLRKLKYMKDFKNLLVTNKKMHLVEPFKKLVEISRDHELNIEKSKCYEHDIYNTDAFVFLLAEIEKEKFRRYEESHKNEKNIISISSDPKNEIKFQNTVEYHNKFKNMKGYLFEEFICMIFITNKIQTCALKLKTKLPYCYDLTLGLIDYIYSSSVIVPIAYDPTIKSFIGSQNLFGERGMFDLALSLNFNQNVEEVELNQGKINSFQLQAFLNGMHNMTLNNIKYLNLSSNLLDSSSGEIIASLLEKMPNLEKLILNKNTLADGSAFIFRKLEELYRLNKSKIAELIMNYTNLDETAIYQLSILIKSQSCKLKCLVVNYSKFDNWAGDKFLRNMKYNKSIEELYMYECGINSSQIEFIKEMIITSKLNTLYLHKNELTNIQNILEIIGLTRLNNIRKFESVKSILGNLDLSSNIPHCINQKHIDMLEELFCESSLYMLDMLNVITKTKVNAPKNKSGNAENVSLNNLIKTLRFFQETKKYII